MARSEARRRTGALALAAVTGALAAITAGLLYGGQRGDLLQLYLVPAVLAGYYLGGFAGILAGLVAGYLTSPFGPLDGLATTLVGSWLFRFVEMAGIGGLTGFLADRLRQQIRSAEEQSVQLAASEQRAMSFLDAQQRYLEELETILAINRAILNEMAVHQAARHLAQLAAELLRADLCLVGLLQDGRRLAYVGVFGPLADRAGLVDKVGGRRIGEGAGGWSLLTEEIVQVPDVLHDPRLAAAAGEIAAAGLRSILAAPLVAVNRPLGALVMAFARPRAYTRADVDRLERLVPQAAVTILDAQRLQQLHRFADETIKSLAQAIEARDQYTGDHSERIERFAMLTARELGLTGTDLEAVRYGALLHDLGKIGIPERLLQKPAALTPSERLEMEQHTAIGAQIARRVSFLRDVVPLIYYHQERHDGSGYPEGLAGEGIPLGARIISVVDAYDAMTSDRPYRPALLPEEVVDWLRKQAGKLFDPAVVEAFLHVLERERSRAA